MNSEKKEENVSHTQTHSTIHTIKKHSNKPFLFIALIFLLALFVLIIIGNNYSTSNTIQFQTINVTQYGFSPANTSITLGSSISFYNRENSDVDIVVTQGPIWFDSGWIAPNSNFKWTFDNPGNYSIREIKSANGLNVQVS